MAETTFGNIAPVKRGHLSSFVKLQRTLRKIKPVTRFMWKNYTSCMIIILDFLNYAISWALLLKKMFHAWTNILHQKIVYSSFCTCKYAECLWTYNLKNQTSENKTKNVMLGQRPELGSPRLIPNIDMSVYISVSHASVYSPEIIRKSRGSPANNCGNNSLNQADTMSCCLLFAPTSCWANKPQGGSIISWVAN